VSRFPIDRRTCARRTTRTRSRGIHRLLLAASVALLGTAGVADADTRCGIELQNDVCLEANPLCPGTAATLGPNPGSWTGFQRDPQHTGRSPFPGPACNNVVWTTKLKGKILAAPTLAEPAEGEPESLYVPVGKIPICALNPDTGATRWCGTNELGKIPDRSSPVVGNGNLLYVGTRDNDLWAIDAMGVNGQQATVAWRQKVCTDGDVTTPPTIGYDGIVYMGSDSLGAGTLMAMCPGTSRQLKWCKNPVGGGGVRNTSPALSLNGERLYVAIGAGALGAFDPEFGTELWRVQFEPPGGVGRAPNYSPVVHPLGGIIYIGTNKGIWAIEHQIDPETGKDVAAARLLFDMTPRRQRVYSPPALDYTRDTLVFGASRGNISTLYAIDLDGNLRWERPLPRGRFRNNPPVIDSDGRIYVALSRTLYAFGPDGTPLWELAGRSFYESSPILASGRLYAAQVNGTVLAVGDCAP